MDQDCVPTGEPKPAIAYGGRRVQFFFTPLHMIVELIEALDHRHVLTQVAEAQGVSGAIPEDRGA
jgi:hypothetical protein